MVCVLVWYYSVDVDGVAWLLGDLRRVEVCVVCLCDQYVRDIYICLMWISCLGARCGAVNCA